MIQFILKIHVYFVDVYLEFVLLGSGYTPIYSAMNKSPRFALSYSSESAIQCLAKFRCGQNEQNNLPQLERASQN